MKKVSAISIHPVSFRASTRIEMPNREKGCPQVQMHYIPKNWRVLDYPTPYQEHTAAIREYNENHHHEWYGLLQDAGNRNIHHHGGEIVTKRSISN